VDSVTAKNLTLNLQIVRERIERAAERAARSLNDICLLAVSKTKSVELVREAMAAGQMDFAENYVQEALTKVEACPTARWHFIGGLQTNKVKQLGARFELIHSVDRLKLAIEIDKAAAAQKREQAILVQINIGEEATKQGIALEDLGQLLDELQKLKNLKIRGLMALPPLTEDERVSRHYFAQVRQALDHCRAQVSSESAALMTELSMGTTHDFELAIEEGATIVRVGTAIFGEREIKN
jgi:pyridoxal phosphate enzyme (YggS family)